MRQELDARLVSKYPLIFTRGPRREDNGPFQYWGFECGDGWYALIDVLCRSLYFKYTGAVHQYERARQLEGTYIRTWDREAQKTVDVLVDAVYVERKRLAMAEEAENVPVAVQVKEKFGTLRFYVDKATTEQYNIIGFAEDMSSRVCEQCGDTSTAQTRSGGWVRTLCNSCEEEYQKDRAQAN